MTKVRIHELAKELHIENKDLLKLLEKMGLGTKNVQSTLEESDVERVKNHISLSRKEGVVEQRVKPTVIRRRVKREEPSAAPTHPVAELQERERAGKKEPAAVPGERPKPLPPPTEKEIAKKLKISAPLPEEIPAPVRGVAPAPSPISAESKTAEEPQGKEIPLAKGGELAVPDIQPGQKGALTSPAEVEKTALTGEREPVAEKPREAEKPHAKPKKKHEPAKIIERPATPPPVIQQILTRGKKEQAPVPSRTPAAASKPPVILQRAGAAFPKTLSEEEERGRRRKKLKKDVQVLEEGKPNRMRIITTKKRIFKEHEYLREERGFRGAEREAKPGSPKLKLLKPEPTVPKATKAIKRKIRITEAILVGELAKRMGVKAAEVIRKLMDLGLMVSINQAIDTDAASLVATEFGYEVEKMGFEIEDLIEEKEEHAEDLIPRSPVVTIMGHVDHGKTSLLDAIRQTNVTAGEAGGITQHIGAYEVNVDHRKVVFLDTPGHEAFTAMRARGAKVTDIVILVVAADDGVMNQTIEAIDHAKAAKVPLIVAINKIDKSQANPDRVKQGLAEYGLMPEAWGGDTIFAETSAKQKIGIKELLEMILLQAEVLELKANPNRPMTGTVIEAKLDKGRGPVATVLVQDGTLYVGDAFVSGIHFGHVRAMSNDRGEKIESAGPSTPVEVIGLSSVPNAGDSFVVVTDERRAKELATQRLMKQREIELAKSAKVTLEDFYKRMQKGAIKDLNLILKADVQGSIEALSEALNRLSTEAVHVNLLHTGVGAINESDCMLASASDAIVIGFNVKVEPKAQALAEQEKIDIRLYNVIYEALNDVRQAMEGLLEPVYEERLVGRAEVRQIFNISKVGVVAGCFVLEGKILRGSHAHLVRDKQVVQEGNITSLKRLKDDFREVTAGFECGITLADFRDFMTQDVIECYVVEKKTAHL